MQTSGVLILLLATAPFLLLPSLFAYTGRKRQRLLILVVNLGLLATILGGILVSGAPLLRLDGSLIAFLVLLGISLKRDRAPAEALDEPVTLMPYDPGWPRAFEAERDRLCAALEVPPDAVEHIGSTAVPGLIAKPVIDLMLGVTRYPPIETIVSRLVILGYQDMGEAQVEGRRYLRMREGISRNVHIVLRGGDHWTNNLRLRDYLRRDAGARERYADAKRTALATGDRLLAYSAAKAPAIAELVAAASAVKDA